MGRVIRSSRSPDEHQPLQVHRGIGIENNKIDKPRTDRQGHRKRLLHSKQRGRKTQQQAKQDTPHAGFRTIDHPSFNTKHSGRDALDQEETTHLLTLEHQDGNNIVNTRT